MLQNIRDRFTGGFAIAILALLCVPFVFFGINYNFIGSSYAAKVNGEEISLFEFENAYRQQLTQYGELAGQLPDNMRNMLKENVLNNLIYETVVDQHLSESNYRISDGMITEFIQQVPEFRVDGRFSKTAYYDFLAARGIDPLVFEANQRIGLRQGQLQRGVAATAFVTPAEYRRYLNLVGEQREVSVATFDIDSIGESIEVGDEAIQAYYDERSEEFRSPETVDFSYVELRRDELARQVEVSDEALREYYEQSRSRFLQDEQRRARHILIEAGDDEAKAEEQATALAARVRAGEPFADLARDYSADGGTAGQGGDLGLLPQSQLPGALGDAIFSMREGEVAGPVRSEFGFHVIRLDDIQQGGPLPFADVRGELERELRAEQADDLWLEKERELSEALFDATDIAAMAETVGLPLQQATGYTRAGGEPFGSNQAAIDAIFDAQVLEERRVSDMIELDANRVVAVQVTNYNQAAPLPLADVRDTIVSRIRNDRARAIAEEKTATLQAALRDGQEFASAAEEAGAGEATTTTIRRDDEEIDASVRDAVFRMKKPLPGEPRIGTAQTSDGDLAVFAVTGFAPGRPEAIPVAQRDEGKLQLAQQAGQSDYVAFVMELERRADVVRNRDAIAQQSLF